MLDGDAMLTALIEFTGPQTGFQLFKQDRESGIQCLEYLRSKCADKTGAVRQKMQVITLLD